MNQVFNPPPNWPKPPAGWSPPPEWRPDPAWGPPPAGWSFWVDPEGEVANVSDPSPGGEQRIFISYRRSDCQAQANGLYDGLGHRLRNASVFMDIDSIPPGVDFEQHIRNEIKRSDVVLVMIGDNWLDDRPGTHRRRIDEANDFVRLEIENALALPEVHIIPVLVEGAQMPPSDEIPASIHQLARLNAFELSDRRWTSDVERLARTVERLGGGSWTPGLGNLPTASRTPHAPGMPSAGLGLGLGVPGAPPAPSAFPVDLAADGREPTGDAGPQPPGGGRHGTAAGWVIAAVPLLTCGFASFAPALWARSQRPGDPAYRRRMLVFSIVVGMVSIGSFVVIGAGGDAPPGSPLDIISSIAVGIWFGAITVATVVGILNRKPAQPGLGRAEDYQLRPRDDYLR